MNDETCCVPNCERHRLTRGLCASCYTSALRSVKAGKTTWEELASLGLCLKPAMSRPATGPFALALEAARRKP